MYALKSPHRDAFIAGCLPFPIVVLSSLGIYALWGQYAALAFGSGGLIWALATFVFYKQLFRYQGASQASKIVKAFYQGELWKGMVTGLGFVGAFTAFKADAFGVLMGYVMAQGAFLSVSVGIGLGWIRVRRAW